MSAAADPVIARLAKDADMRSKPILEPPQTCPSPRSLSTFAEALLNSRFSSGKRVCIVFPPAPVKTPPPPPNAYGAK